VALILTPGQCAAEKAGIAEGGRAMDEGLKRVAGQVDDDYRRDDAQAMGKAAELTVVDALRRFIDAIANADFVTAEALVADDAEYEMFAVGTEMPLRMSGRGRAEIVANMRHNFGAMVFENVEVDTLVAQGDVVVMIARQRGRWRATDAPFDDRVVLRYRFRDGKLVNYRGWAMPFAE
jgi:ketosteroid isomerase-like protein